MALESSDQACPDEAELAAFVERRISDTAAEAVRVHLDGCDTCRQVVTGWVRGSDADFNGGPSVRTAALPAGTMLAHYRLERVLGEGGMGVVYAAADHKLERPVAIKLLRGDGVEDEARLLAEARAMARVSHPAVLTVYEVGQHDGVVFVATELISGGTLREHLERRPHTAAENIELFARAGDGLAAAHAQGVVHRDFKASNVLVELRPGSTPEVARVLVADFGLAVGAGARHDLPDGGRRAGTLRSMAPEQLDGAPCDARADVFSFAAALWEALFGAPPFSGRTATELRAAMRTTPVPPPSARAPAHIIAALLAALKIDPAVRTESMQALLRELRRRTPVSRVRWALISIAAAAGVAAMAFGGLHARDAAAKRACEAALKSPWASEVATWDQRAERAGVPAWVRERVIHSVDERERPLAALVAQTCAASPESQRAVRTCRSSQAILEAAALQALATPWSTYDRLDDALELPWIASCLGRAAELDVVLEPSTEPEVSQLKAGRLTLAKAHFAALSGATQKTWGDAVARLTGPTAPSVVRERLAVEVKLEEAVVQPKRSAKERLTIDEAAAEQAERSGNLTAGARAWLQVALERSRTRAEERTVDQAFQQADWAIDRVGNPPELRTQWHSGMAFRAWQKSAPDEAARHASAAATIATSAGQRRGSLQALANAAAARADYAAQRQALEALLADPSITAVAGTDTALLFARYAECLYKLGDIAAARQAIDKAQAIFAANGAIAYPEHADVVLVRGFIELDENKPDDCLESIDEALSILKKTVGPGHQRFGSALNLRASALSAKGDIRGALAASETAAELFTALLGARSEESIYSRSQIGEGARKLGELGRAESVLTEAVADSRALFGTEDPRTAFSEHALADVHAARGHRTQALALLEHAMPALEAAHADVAYAAQVKVSLARLIADVDRPRALRLADEALEAWRGQEYWKPETEQVIAWRATLKRTRH